MPGKKANLFIDGSNFYHALKENNLFNAFSYSSFFKELSKEFDITKVFFYDAMKSQFIEPDQYPKQQAFHERLKKDIQGIVLKTRKLKYLPSNKRIEEAKKSFPFCSSCKRKVDDFLSKAGLLKLSKEKGVDILLVTDMINNAFNNDFEIALLASGDADFTPAVELTQKLKKQVINLHFYKGSSSELRNACNAHKLIQVDAKGSCYFQ